jgi:hypothetical protein
MEVENSSLFLPWYNFKLIEHLQSYLKPEMNIFEYGSGFSSLFYAQNGCTVYGVETRIEWKKKIEDLAKENDLNERINIELCENVENFYKAILQYEKIFDVIIVDSIQRLACLKEAKFVYIKGLIILDNSERLNLIDAKNIMMGFDFIEFQGKRPHDENESSALVFFK